jgi:hypothetical protein
MISLDIQNIVIGFQSLLRLLSGSMTGFPFTLRFQIQKLAQNNYLLPETVLSLIPEITRMMKRSSLSVCVGSLKKLFTQIPFAGPGTEADQLEVASIIELLQSNENNYNKYGLSVDEINAQERSENVAIIHKVNVTPSGTYLYGPEPESNNRVLRKYPNHHDYFIRVQFCDEDGQPIRFTSGIEIRLLKHKSRIPVEKGWHLHGIMDETGFLKEGQIYCVVKNEYGTLQAITGKNLIISRAPALHPGDVQLVEGVVPPRGSPLRALHNCIVFSQKGSRDLPSQLSSGDLDGDRYYLIWDEAAMPKRSYGPADYPRVDPIDIGRQVTKDDMIDFFIQFMETDQLGRIAVLHRVLADQRDLGTLDPDCLTLAEMHSTAVDFSKTGIPVFTMFDILRTNS